MIGCFTGNPDARPFALGGCGPCEGFYIPSTAFDGRDYYRYGGLLREMGQSEGEPLGCLFVWERRVFHTSIDELYAERGDVKKLGKVWNANEQ